MENKEKIEINDDLIEKVTGAGEINQKEEEKKKEPKRTLHAGDCFEFKEEVTSYRVKILQDYIDVSAVSSIVKVDMRRFYNPNMMVLNEYLNIDMPIIYYLIEDKNYVGNNVW